MPETMRDLVKIIGGTVLICGGIWAIAALERRYLVAS